MSVPAPAPSINKTFSVIKNVAEYGASGMKIPLPTELYRQIFVSLDLPADIGPVIGLTSAVAGEGRTTVALGLALTLAADLDTRILLVDTNLDRPSLHTQVDVPLEPGLADVLRGEVSLEEAMHEVSKGLFVVPSGAAGDDGFRLLHLFFSQDLFTDMREQGVVTILDLPPILNNSYSSMAASLVDALVLVIRAGTTRADIVGSALGRLKIKPHGVVLNGQQTVKPPWRLRRQRR